MELTGRRRGVVVATVTLLATAALLGTTAAASSRTATPTHLAFHAAPNAPASSPAIAPITTTTAAPVVTTTTTPPVTPPATPSVTPVAPTATTAPAQPSGYGCPAALAYLAANAAPGFIFECPGSADGHEAMTCINNSLCPGEHLIVIADPCPAAYMNEAYNSNSWSDALSEFTRPLDPYGSC